VSGTGQIPGARPISRRRSWLRGRFGRRFVDSCLQLGCRFDVVWLHLRFRSLRRPFKPVEAGCRIAGCSRRACGQRLHGVKTRSGACIDSLRGENPPAATRRCLAFASWLAIKELRASPRSFVVYIKPLSLDKRILSGSGTMDSGGVVQSQILALLPATPASEIMQGVDQHSLALLTLGHP
jgi:hypothetical protein